MASVLAAVIPILAGLVAVLYFRTKAQVAEAQLSAATQAAAGAADRAQQLEGALTALRAKIDDESKNDRVQGDAAKGSAATAGDYLRDSLKPPSVLGHDLPKPGPGTPQGLMSIAARAHAPRFVPGFGRGR